MARSFAGAVVAASRDRRLSILRCGCRARRFGAVSAAVVLAASVDGAHAASAMPERFAGSLGTDLVQPKIIAGSSTFSAFSYSLPLDGLVLTRQKQTTQPTPGIPLGATVYKLTSGSARFSGYTETVTFTNQPGTLYYQQAHGCTWTVTVKQSGALSGSLVIDGTTATLTFAVPTSSVSTLRSGACAGWGSSITSAGGSATGRYDAASGTVSFNVTIRDGTSPESSITHVRGKLTSAAGSVGSKGPTGPKGATGSTGSTQTPPGGDENCEQKASGDEPCTQCPNITVLPSRLPPAKVGSAYRVQLEGLGGEPPYSFQALGSLPGGLALSAAGLLSGTPSVPGTQRVNFNLLDARGCAGTNQVFSALLPQSVTLLLQVKA
jgi:hypothetical protein